MIHSLSFPDEMPAAKSMGNGRWKLTEAWPFSINDIECTIPVGFVTDLFSAPWIVNPVIPKDQKDNRPAMIHDYLFATVGLRPTSADAPQIGLAASNRALLFAMRICQFRLLRQWSIYTGVAIGGRFAWAKLARAGHSLSNPCMT